MYIIAGLGNPTLQYEGTRHNVGFNVIDVLADKYNISVDTRKNLGTEVFPRIKEGVGEKPKNYDLADYVLGHFSKAERELMEEGYKQAVCAIETILEEGTDAAMNLYNRKVRPAAKEV